MKTRLEYRDAKSNKYWEAEVTDGKLVVRNGAIGAKSSDKPVDCEDAVAEFKRRVAAKIKDGYVEVGAAANVPAKAAEPAADKSAAKGPAAKLDFKKEDFAKVVKEFGLSGTVGEAGFSAKGPCLVHRGDAAVDELSFMKIVPFGTETVVIAGNLTVRGGISQDMDSRNGHVIVTGNARADSLWSSGNGFLVVQGDLDLKHYAYGCYNDGAAYVGGVTRVPYVFNSDHCLCLNATADEVDVFNRDAEELREELAEGCFEDDEFSMSATARFIESGKSPFRKAKKK